VLKLLNLLRLSSSKTREQEDAEERTVAQRNQLPLIEMRFRKSKFFSNENFYFSMNIKVLKFNLTKINLHKINQKLILIYYQSEIPSKFEYDHHI